MGRVGKHSVCFFDKKHFNTLKTKLDIAQYRKFIRAIHLRVCEEVILESKEGFIIPMKLGEIRIQKEKKTEGVFTTQSRIQKSRKEYNPHTFGYIYKIAWDKKIRGRVYHMNHSNLVPRYNTKPITWFTIYRFTATRYHLKRALAKKIFNQEFAL